MRFSRLFLPLRFSFRSNLLAVVKDRRLKKSPQFDRALISFETRTGIDDFVGMADHLVLFQSDSTENEYSLHQASK